MAFENFDLSNFWNNTDYALKTYVGQKLTKNMVEIAQNKIGYTFPISYITLLANQNGGIPYKTYFPIPKTTEDSKQEYVTITGIFGINPKTNSLLGSMGSKALIEEWGYPPIGMVVCNCQEVGHENIMLDYRQEGIPQVVHVDVQVGEEPVITYLAQDFEQFIQGLVQEIPEES